MAGEGIAEAGTVFEARPRVTELISTFGAKSVTGSSHKKGRPPEDKESFGYALWLVIGGPTTNIRKAAEHLGMYSTVLGDLLHSKSKFTQHYLLEKKKIRAVLAEHYPDGWKEHQQIFEERLALLPEKKAASASKASPKTPADQESLGYALWLILGGENANIRQAAKKLGIKRSILTGILHNRPQSKQHKTVTSQQYLKNKKIRAGLEKHYPEGWEKYRKLFGRRVALLPKKGNIQSQEPANKDTFGHVLWTILGGPQCYLSEAAKHLGISLNFLGSIISGRSQPSQAALTAKDWRQVLSTHYAKDWAANEEHFEQYAKQLPTVTSKVYEPENKESLGYVLWAILGKEKAKLSLAAELLGMDRHPFVKIIKDKGSVSRQFLLDKHWRTTLATHYTKAWAENESAFEAYVERLPLINSRHASDETLYREALAVEQADAKIIVQQKLAEEAAAAAKVASSFAERQGPKGPAAKKEADELPPGRWLPKPTVSPAQPAFDSAQSIAGHEWPGTLWNPDSELRCKNCCRTFEWHGATEWIVKKLGLPLNQQHQVCKPKDSHDVEDWIVMLRLDSEEPKVADTPTQPKKQTVIPSPNSRELQRQERASPPLNNRVFRTSAKAVTPNDRERQSAEELSRAIREINRARTRSWLAQTSGLLSAADHDSALPGSIAGEKSRVTAEKRRDSGDSRAKAHTPECSCPTCASPQLAPRSGRRAVPKPVCLRSPQCRVSGTELLGETLCCAYCGLPRTTGAPASGEHAPLRQFEVGVPEEVEAF